jgi:hypothetical protein
MRDSSGFARDDFLHHPPARPRARFETKPMRGRWSIGSRSGSSPEDTEGLGERRAFVRDPAQRQGAYELAALRSIAVTWRRASSMAGSIRCRRRSPGFRRRAATHGVSGIAEKQQVEALHPPVVVASEARRSAARHLSSEPGDQDCATPAWTRPWSNAKTIAAARWRKLEFVQHAPEVGLHRRLGNDQALRDLFVREPATYEEEHFTLTGRKTRHGGQCGNEWARMRDRRPTHARRRLGRCSLHNAQRSALRAGSPRSARR